jgi:hypothetical protein
MINQNNQKAKRPRIKQPASKEFTTALFAPKQQVPPQPKTPNIFDNAFR